MGDNSDEGCIVHIDPFKFPHWLPVREWEKHQFHVGMMNDETAAAYWDELKPLWIAHCKLNREEHERMLASWAKADNEKTGG